MNYQTVYEPYTTLADPGIGMLMVSVDTSRPSWVTGGIVNLPATPKAGSRVVIKDVGGLAATKTILVQGVGNLIDGSPTYSIQVAFAAPLLVYSGSQWLLI